MILLGKLYNAGWEGVGEQCVEELCSAVGQAWDGAPEFMNTMPVPGAQWPWKMLLSCHCCKDCETPTPWDLESVWKKEQPLAAPSLPAVLPAAPFVLRRG